MKQANSQVEPSRNGSAARDVVALGAEIGSTDEGVRARAAHALSRFPEDAAAQALLARALYDRAASVREAATAALDAMIAARPVVVAELAQAQRDAREISPSWSLERYLARVGTLEAVDPLLDIQVTGSQPETEMLDAIAASPHIGTDALVTRLEQVGPARRPAVAQVLVRRGHEKGFEALFRGPYLKSLIDKALALGADGIRILGRSFDESDLERRRFVIEHVVARPNVAAYAVHEVLLGDDWEPFSFAVNVVRFWDNPRTIDALLRHASERTRDPRVRELCIYVLCELQAPEAVELFGEAIVEHEHDATFIAQSSARALGHIGNDAARAALESTRGKVSDKGVVKDVREALERFEE